MKYIEANKIAIAITKKITEQLQGYGYTDVILRKYPTRVRTAEFTLTNSIRIFFWNASYGYMLSVAEKNTKDPAVKICDFDGFISMCEKIVSFAADVNILEGDYTTSFGEFLEQNGLLNVKAFWPRISIDSATVGFYNEQYIVSLNRVDPDMTVSLLSEELDDDCDEDHEERPDKAIYGYLEDEIIKSITECSSLAGYRYDISFDWSQIGVGIYNCIQRYELYIEFTMGYVVSAYQIKEIVDSFIRQISKNTRNLIADLDLYSKYCFHEHSRNDDEFSATVCEGLDVFRIAAWSEDIARKGIKKVSLLSPEPVFDRMSGIEFEIFCADLLRSNGFVDVSITSGSGDQGVDIIAFKDSIKYGIQCKCYTADIGNKAVQEVLAGKTFYDCDVGVVLTNRHFTKSAILLAKRSRIHLWDRGKLIQLLNSGDKATY